MMDERSDGYNVNSHKKKTEKIKLLAIIIGSFASCVKEEASYYELPRPLTLRDYITQSMIPAIEICGIILDVTVLLTLYPLLIII